MRIKLNRIHSCMYQQLKVIKVICSERYVVFTLFVVGVNSCILNNQQQNLSKLTEFFQKN